MDGSTPIHLAAAQRRKAYSNEHNTFLAVKCLAENGAKINIKNNKGETPFDVAKLEVVKDYLLEKQNEAFIEATTKEIVTNQDPCIICHSPRDGFYVLMPCMHASLCEVCCKNITKQKFSKCPSCRRPIKEYSKIFFQSAEWYTIHWIKDFHNFLNLFKFFKIIFCLSNKIQRDWLKIIQSVENSDISIAIISYWQ